MTVLLWSIGILMVMAIMTKSTSTFSITPPVNGTPPNKKAENWDPDRYSTNAAFVSELGKDVLFNSLAPESGERILDIGCGDGTLTIELQKRGCKVVGIDFAPDMIAAAVERGVEAYVMDASSIDAPFLLSKINGCDDANNASSEDKPTANIEPSSRSCEDQGAAALLENSCNGQFVAFDAVFTNAVFHWIKRPLTAIEGAKRVLRPGGRFVGEFGGHGNIAAIRVALHNALRRRGIDPIEVDPWYYPTPEELRLLLETAGFVVDDIALFPRPTVLPRDTGMRGWLATFARTFLNTLLDNSDDDDASHKVDANGLNKVQVEVIDEVLSALQQSLRDQSGLWTADYVRVIFRAHLPHGECIE